MKEEEQGRVCADADASGNGPELVEEQATDKRVSLLRR